MTKMWYEEHLEMRKTQSAPIRFLLWVGFVKFGRKSTICDFGENGELIYRYPEQIIWPFHSSPRHMVRYLIKTGPRFYLFRNLPGVIKWLPGRLLPMRWGFGICGFEFGDRG